MLTLFAPENMKKPYSKITHNWPRPFFSVLPIGPNPARISIPVPYKSPYAGLLYCDFGCHGPKKMQTEFVTTIHLPFVKSVTDNKV